MISDIKSGSAAERRFLNPRASMNSGGEPAKRGEESDVDVILEQSQEESTIPGERVLCLVVNLQIDFFLH